MRFETKTVQIILLSLVVFAFASCESRIEPTPSPITPEEEAKRGEVVSYTKLVHMSLDELKKEINDSLLNPKLLYGITAYKIVYKSQYEDDSVEAEALLLVPDYAAEDSVKYATYFHGTILPFKLKMIDTTTPSQFNGHTKSKDIKYCALPLAAAGYCVITPDYTGYGPTSNRDHPFVYYPELIKSAEDGVIAGRRTLKNKLGINVDPEKIWLTGWSQGGGLSLYAQRKWEDEYVNKPDKKEKFKIMANSTLAGPFSIEHFITDMMEHTDRVYLVLALYSWATYTFNRFDHNLQRPYDQIFRPDIYDQKSAILVVNTPGELYQDFFTGHIKNRADQAFINAMEICGTSKEWTPQADVYMHHGKEDMLVPYFNMIDALEGLAASKRVYGYTEVDGGHSSFVPKYMAHTIDLFWNPYMAEWK